MTVGPLIFTEADVRAAVSVDDALASARTAFLALHREAVESPTPWHLDVTEHAGELHVKGAVLQEAPYFAVKVSTGFPHNAARGLPTSDGMTVVLEAATGRIAALFLDGGYLTELRTGAAGALALDLLGPVDLEELAIIGTGFQARFQVEAALRVRAPRRISVHGRDRSRAEVFGGWIAERTGAEVSTALLDGSPITAQAIITVTTATAPVLHPGQVAPGAHITAVGSDSPGKRELAVELVRAADLVAVDSIQQSRTIGELQGIDDITGSITTLGALLAAGPSIPRDPQQLTIADLSGTGAQDAAITSIAATRLLGP